MGGIVQALLDGPLPGEDVLPTLPTGTQLLGARVQDGIATLNFSAHLRTQFSGGSAAETMLVYSVVNSLTTLSTVRAVRFEVDGAPLDTLGHLDLTGPVFPQPLDGGG